MDLKDRLIYVNGGSKSARYQQKIFSPMKNVYAIYISSAQYFYGFLSKKGGVHICKPAYGDLTWENSNNPESYALWYTFIYQLWGVYGVFHVANVWIQPWANSAQYMDPTLWRKPNFDLYGSKNFFALGVLNFFWVFALNNTLDISISAMTGNNLQNIKLLKTADYFADIKGIKVPG